MAGRQVRSAAAVAVLAADVLELAPGAGDLVAAVLPEADHVAADALGVGVGAVSHERVEGARVRGEQPGLVLRLVADAADLVPAEAGLAQQHRDRKPRQLGQAHAQQGHVDLGREALPARGDATLRVDQDDDRARAPNTP